MRGPDRLITKLTMIIQIRGGLIVFSQIPPKAPTNIGGALVAEGFLRPVERERERESEQASNHVATHLTVSNAWFDGSIPRLATAEARDCTACS